MNHIAPLHEPLIREVPLSRLALAPENVRKTPADPIAEAEMKASIATHGLLEAVESIDSPAEGGRVAAARAAANGNGHAEQAAPETGPSGADDGNDAGDDGQIAGTVDTAIPEDADAAADGMPPAHINGRDAAPDPLEIPEFLRRVH